MTTNALQAVLDRAARRPVPEKPAVREPADAPAAAAGERARVPAAREVRREAGEPSRHRRPVREGKRFVGAHFAPEVARQLKVLAAEDGATIQELLEQAVDLLFVKNGKTKIGELVGRT